MAGLLVQPGHRRSGLAPEKNATLKLYNWVAYINQKDLKEFAKKYKCKVELTTFNTMTRPSPSSEPVSSTSTSSSLPSMCSASWCRASSSTAQPLATSRTSRRPGPEYQNPFYDQKWQYTVPYTIYTTGIAWRKDKVDENPNKMANVWAMPWQRQYKGKVAILDDYREGLAWA